MLKVNDSYNTYKHAVRLGGQSVARRGDMWIVAFPNLVKTSEINEILNFAERIGYKRSNTTGFTINNISRLGTMRNSYSSWVKIPRKSVFMPPVDRITRKIEEITL